MEPFGNAYANGDNMFLCWFGLIYWHSVIISSITMFVCFSFRFYAFAFAVIGFGYAAKLNQNIYPVFKLNVQNVFMWQFNPNNQRND